ncbi:hypothetical protein [Lysobacter gummosus]|uniref:hypothetical protein n=1 Tax=Lysobacter gummosus TaxID=262324 RepID=UPI003643EDB0
MPSDPCLRETNMKYDTMLEPARASGCCEPWPGARCRRRPCSPSPLRMRRKRRRPRKRPNPSSIKAMSPGC